MSRQLVKPITAKHSHVINGTCKSTANLYTLHQNTLRSHTQICELLIHIFHATAVIWRASSLPLRSFVNAYLL